MIKKIVILTLIFVPFLCQAQVETIIQNDKNIKSLSDELNIPKEKLYFIAEESKRPDNYEGEESFSSLINFIKGSKSIGCDKLDPNYEKLNCDLTEISKKQINESFKGYNSFEGMIFKNVKTKKVFSFPDDKIIATLIYSSQLKGFVDYSNQIKSLDKLESAGVLTYFVIVQEYTEK